MEAGVWFEEALALAAALLFLLPFRAFAFAFSRRRFLSAASWRRRRSFFSYARMRARGGSPKIRSYSQNSQTQMSSGFGGLASNFRVASARLSYAALASSLSM